MKKRLKANIQGNIRKGVKRIKHYVHGGTPKDTGVWNQEDMDDYNKTMNPTDTKSSLNSLLGGNPGGGSSDTATKSPGTSDSPATDQAKENVKEYSNIPILGGWIQAGAHSTGATIDLITKARRERAAENERKNTVGRNLSLAQNTGPYADGAYMQGDPGLYTMMKGGTVEDKKKRNLSTVISNQNHLTPQHKEEGGEVVPDDLSSMFDEALEASGGDEAKAFEMIRSKHNKPRLKKKR